MDVSVVVCTHNRAPLLLAALTHLSASNIGALQTEIIVVDNNSTDDTAEVVRQFAATSPIEVRYTFEPAQGISNARNTGWAAARGAIVAFTDDDVRVEPDWMARLAAAFERNPDISCVGGKVLPGWPAPPPGWLTKDHWAPLAILDYGDSPIRLGHHDPRCLVGANVAFRREVFAQVGGFASSVQRVKDGIGSIEDHEFLLRLWDSGKESLYVPEIVVVAPVDRPRLDKRYHRRWHQGHGHFHAIMAASRDKRQTPIDGRKSRELFGVPAWQYRQCLASGAAWLLYMAQGRESAAFKEEARLRFFWGFFQTRRRAYMSRRLGSLARWDKRERSAPDQHSTQVP